jgi:hypothetical protein
MSNWLKQETDMMVRLDEAEDRGYMNAYIHCRELLNQMSFYCPSDKCRVVRLEQIEDILSKNIEYYGRNLKK